MNVPDLVVQSLHIFCPQMGFEKRTFWFSFFMENVMEKHETNPKVFQNFQCKIIDIFQPAFPQREFPSVQDISYHSRTDRVHSWLFLGSPVYMLRKL